MWRIVVGTACSSIRPQAMSAATVGHRKFAVAPGRSLHIFGRGVILHRFQRPMKEMPPPHCAADASDAPDPAAEARFVAFLERQQGTLYRVACFYCRNREERRDLVQEMVVQLWRSFGRFEGRSAEATWTYRVATNVAISHRRREGRRVHHVLGLDGALDVADRVMGTDSEQLAALRELLDSLDGVSRALVFFHIEGFDHTQIAEMIGTSTGNVGTRLNRIKAALKAKAAGKE